MSGTTYPALAVNPPDVLGPMMRYAQIGETQARTQGIQLGNQMNALMLGYRQNLLAPFMGGQPGAVGGVASGAPAAPAAGGGGGMPSYVMSPIGIPLPPMLYASAALSQNPDQAFKAAADMRRQRLYELASQSSADTWAQNVHTAYQEGWLTPQQAAQVASRPDMRAQVLQSLATPEANLGFQGRAIGQGVQPDANGNLVPSPAVVAAKTAIATGEAAGKAQFEPPIEVKVPTGEKDAHGQDIYRVDYVPRTGIQAYMQSHAGAQTATAADLSNPNVVLSPAAYAGRVTARESGGNYDAQSGTSSAGGGAQFTDGTWLATIKAARPDLAQGKTDQQLLAMKTDTSPEGRALQNQMAVAYAQQNAPTLGKAGLPVNSLTLGLAHQFGPQGAVNILTKPADTPITPQLVGADAMKANPQFRGKTIADVQAAAFRVYGVNGVNLTGGGAAPAGAPQAPAAGGAVAGPPVLTPQQTADVDVQKQQRTQDIDQFTKYKTDLLEQSQSAQAQNALIDNMLAHSQTWRMGKFSDVKMDLFKTLDAVGQPIGFKPDQSVGDWEAFNKDAVNLLRQAVHETKNVRAVQEWNVLAKSLPQDETTPQGFTRIAGEIQGLNDWKQAKSYAAGKWQGNANEFEGQWNSNVSPMAYIVNRLSVPDTQTLAQNLNKTEQGRAIWRDIVQQTKMLNDKGLLRTATTPHGTAPG